MYDAGLISLQFRKGRHYDVVRATVGTGVRDRYGFDPNFYKSNIKPATFAE